MVWGGPLDTPLRHAARATSPAGAGEERVGVGEEFEEVLDGEAGFFGGGGAGGGALGQGGEGLGGLGVGAGELEGAAELVEGAEEGQGVLEGGGRGEGGELVEREVVAAGEVGGGQVGVVEVGEEGVGSGVYAGQVCLGCVHVPEDTGLGAGVKGELGYVRETAHGSGHALAQ